MKKTISLLRNNWLDISLILLATALILGSVFFRPTVDEMDNILGAKLLLEGKFPYIDFFSHHVPGMYFLSVPVYLISGNNILLYRFLFDVMILALILLNGHLIKRYVSAWSMRAYLLLMGIAFVSLSAQIALAESILLHIATLIFILLFIRNGRLGIKLVVTLSLLLFAIPFLSISYIFIALIFYLYLAYTLLRQQTSILHLTKIAALLAAPYLLALLILIVSHSLKRFLFENIDFNAKYYGPIFGDMGSSPIQVLVTTITNSLGQIVDVVRSILSNGLTIQMLLLLAYPFAAYWFWIQRKRVEAICVVFILLLINSRVGIYAPPGISSGLDNMSQHALLYKGFAVVLSAITLPFFIQTVLPFTHKTSGFKKTRALICAILLLLLPILFLQQDIRIYKDEVLHKTKPSFYSYQSRLPNGYVAIMNSLLNKDDFYWTGPIDFQNQLFINAQNASRYRFFLPWHSACTQCKDEFMDQIDSNKPKIIYWQETVIANIPANSYGAELEVYLEQNYFTIPSDPRLQGLYFANSQSKEFKESLRNKGYIIE